MPEEVDQQRVENLGPAERIIQALLTHADHVVHNRPGAVLNDPTGVLGAKWVPVTWKDEEGARTVYRLDKRHSRKGRQITDKVAIGRLNDNDQIVHGGRVIGRYQKPGLFQEAAVHLYRQIAEIYEMDNDFVARWASHAFGQEHRDLKVALAAFMLVQARKGDPIREGDEVLFYDQDYRDVGEAMVLLRRRDGRDINPKLLLRVGDLLRLPEIAEINRKLGFGRSRRNPPMGRYPKAVTKYLRHREQNTKMLEGLVNAGFRRTIMRLAQSIGYKPESASFFKTLRWPQKQSNEGHRTIAIGEAVDAADSWEALTEAEICQKITEEKPNYKRVVGLLPKKVGLTRAVMAACIEAGSLSDSDLIILAPTLEELGLLDVKEIKDRFEAALMRAENMRAANIAKRMRKQDNVDALEKAADDALKKEIEEATRDLRVYVAVDISGSMQNSIEQAKRYLAQFVQGFPLDRLHVCVFNTGARPVQIRHASAAGVQNAFSGFRAGGGTNYGAAVRYFSQFPPKPEEDVLMLFVGDEGQWGTFFDRVQDSGLNPVAFGLLKVGNHGRVVHDTANRLGIPCFDINQEMFDDAYAISRTFRRLIEATPVNQAPGRQIKRKTLVEQILETDLLKKPVWA
jgi:hypothetical protein